MEHHVWYPLYDTPVTLTMSREQLQIAQDVLRGDLTTSKKGWREYIADEFEKVLRESLNQRGEAARALRDLGREIEDADQQNRSQ